MIPFSTLIYIAIGAPGPERQTSFPPKKIFSAQGRFSHSEFFHRPDLALARQPKQPRQSSPAQLAQPSPAESSRIQPSPAESSRVKASPADSSRDQPSLATVASTSKFTSSYLSVQLLAVLSLHAQPRQYCCLQSLVQKCVCDVDKTCGDGYSR